MRILHLFVAVILMTSTCYAQHYQQGLFGPQQIISYADARDVEQPSYRGGVQVNAGYRQSAAVKHWNWSKPAPWHDAAVAVKCGRYGGTGTLIQAVGNVGIVLTAYHVVKGQRNITVTWKNGHVSAGRYLDGSYSAGGSDFAIIQVTPPKNRTIIELAQSTPRVGSTIEVLGYGGATASPSRGLRHFAGKITEIGDVRLSTDTRVISGDSGSGIISYGKLVGVVSGYSHQVGSIDEGGQRWAVGTPTRATALPVIRRMLSRWRCGPNGCFPVSPTLPPTRLPAQSPTLPPTQPIDPLAPITPAKPTPAEKIDYQKLLDLMATDSRFKGKQGEKGERGERGKDAELDVMALAKAIKSTLPPITFNLIGPDGNVISSEAIPLGGQFNLHHLPK